MKNILIPKDIQNYVRKKVISCVLFFVGLEALAAALNIFIFDSLSSVSERWLHILVIITLQIVPFVISKFPFKIIDRSWSGEVISVNIETNTGAYTAGGTKVYPYTKHEILLEVKQQNGKIVKIKAKEVGERSHVGFPVPNEGDIKNYINYYSAGDKVYHFYGVPNCYIIKKLSDKNDCVICGTQNTGERDNCLNCGYSLIKRRLDNSVFNTCRIANIDS